MCVFFFWMNRKIEDCKSFFNYIPQVPNDEEKVDEDIVSFSLYVHAFMAKHAYMSIIELDLI
jgi:hypothetical protein